MSRSAKITIRLVLAAVLVVGGALVYFGFFFELVPVSRTHLATAEVSSAAHRLEAYYVDAGATSAGAVELRRAYASGEHEIIGTAEVGWRPDSLALIQKKGYVEAVLWHRSGAGTTPADTLRFLQK